MKKFFSAHMRFIIRTIAFAIMAVAFIYVLYIGIGSHAKAINKREDATKPTLLTDIKETSTSDPNAPAGVRRSFRFPLDTAGKEGISLIFYLHNSWAKVSIGGETVYTYKGSLASVSESGVGSAWVMIPIWDDDSGKECTVTVEPVYESAIENSIDFYIGDPHQLNQLSVAHDALAIYSCVICIVVGILYLAIAMIEFFIIGSRTSPMGWLGMTAVLMALWRLLDMRSFALFIPGNGTTHYIGALISLSLAPFAAVLYEREASPAIPRKVMNAIVLYMAAICAFQIFSQMAGIFTLRQTLPLTHISILIAYVIVIAEPIHSWKKHHNDLLLLLPLIVTIGAVLDLTFYYHDSLSQNITFSLIAMSVYITVSGIRYLGSLQTQSYLDGITGLFNQRRYNEEKESLSVASIRPGIVMMDLNGLKRINDTFGHAQGDEFIKGFAGVLQRSANRGTTLFRAGGDEFVAIINNATISSLERFYSNMRDELEAWNAANPGFNMSVSRGAALSIDHPGLSMQALSDLADAAMYEDKKAFYSQPGNDRRSGANRRSGADRSCGTDQETGSSEDSRAMKDLRARLIRRSGKDRRSGTDRRAENNSDTR